ncbi:MAG: hypothetical protein KatS3mg126_0359 [Lysobacteraceae bacterium]|nr:MAG: hypothetical protein KatS3mg126_0359 [Xanthomonadaceae bacterium]
MLKVQLEGQRIRVRVDEALLARLRAGESLVAHTRLPPAPDFRITLRLVDGERPLWDGSPALGAMLGLPRSRVEHYAERLPCRQGLLLDLQLPEGVGLSIEFSVDVRDSLSVRGPRTRTD